MLVMSTVEVKYLDVILVLKGVSLEVPDSKIVALLGGRGGWPNRGRRGDGRECSS